MGNEQIGSWAFILGVLIAVIVGLVGTFVALGTAAGRITLVLVILGFIVGFINISTKELNDFLTAGIAVIITAGFVGTLAPLTALNTLITPLGTLLNSMFQNIVIFAAPAVLIVGLKAIFNIAKSV